MRINTNVAALNSYNQLKNTQNSLSKSLERLSSGKRINRAADDAAGLAISEKMNAQTRGLAMAQRNAQDGISMIQTAEGALKETHSILQRMRELSVQASNDTNTTEDRGEIQKEITQLTAELDRIADTTQFNKQNLLNGGLGGAVDSANTDQFSVTGVADVTTSGAKADTYSVAVESTGNLKMTDTNGNSQVISNQDGAQSLNFSDFGVVIETNASYTADDAIGDVKVTSGSATFQIGANKDQHFDLSIGDMSSTGLTVGGLSVNTQSDANDAIATIDSAIESVSAERSKLGAAQNRLDHTINNLSTAEENLTAAESRISDVDMAKEMMNMSKQQILSQAGTAMMAQANQLPQGVLQLLG